MTYFMNRILAADNAVSATTSEDSVRASHSTAAVHASQALEEAIDVLELIFRYFSKVLEHDDVSHVQLCLKRYAG